MKEKINVGMIGLGTVGSGALRILRDNAEPIRQRLGVPVEITKIAVRDLKRDRGLRLAGGVLTDNPREIIEDPNIDIVVELIGGYQPSLRRTRPCWQYTEKKSAKLHGGRRSASALKEALAAAFR